MGSGGHRGNCWRGTKRNGDLRLNLYVPPGTKGNNNNKAATVFISFIEMIQYKVITLTIRTST